ncbi:hypothetical protein M3P05_15195 [Sansalvadorimonas sp. 2012CJ34-2]|uniref:Uncharacterized protein n=1 Tax=Parendozoicomonas callyspongiae TaxID=2942213 RepID=A0ABT0PJW2_9GAMM|nr:hypothetical protein [Sansalvadorimonas sp. 2012CJ34-2]MCL6271271.1 hypothetical protein [Sansalvadorimonas sp. 2012CJ34-2]
MAYPNTAPTNKEGRISCHNHIADHFHIHNSGQFDDNHGPEHTGQIGKHALSQAGNTVTGRGKVRRTTQETSPGAFSALGHR